MTYKSITYKELEKVIKEYMYKEDTRIAKREPKIYFLSKESREAFDEALREYVEHEKKKDEIPIEKS